MSAASFDVIVVGGASTDFVAQGPQLPGPGQELQGEHFCQLPGGKGANQAIAIARLGGRVALIARLGADDRGDAILDQLRQDGVDIRFCMRDADAHTSAILVMVDHAGTKQTCTVPGATHRLSPADIERAMPLFDHSQALLLQFEPPRDTVMHAITLARRMGLRVLLDPSPMIPSLPEALLQQLYLVRANAKEASDLTGIHVHDPDTARQAGHWFIDRGIEVAAVDTGMNGNVLIWRGGDVYLPRLPVKTVDKTGAGDAFIAGLAVAMREGLSWPEVGRFANAAAALTTTRLGAEPALPRREEVVLLLQA